MVLRRHSWRLGAVVQALIPELRCALRRREYQNMLCGEGKPNWRGCFIFVDRVLVLTLRWATLLLSRCWQTNGPRRLGPSGIAVLGDWLPSLDIKVEAHTSGENFWALLESWSAMFSILVLTFVRCWEVRIRSMLREDKQLTLAILTPDDSHLHCP